MGAFLDYNTGLGSPQREALRTLATTGMLPKDRRWDALRARHDAHPGRFDHSHPVLGALLDRDLAQRTGRADGDAPLLPDRPLWAALVARHDAHPLRFDHYHPFLGRLLELKLPERPRGEVNIAPPVLPAIEFGAPWAFSGGGTTSLGGPPPGSTPPVASVPEPSGGVLLGLGLIGALLLGRRWSAAG